MSFFCSRTGFRNKISGEESQKCLPDENLFYKNTILSGRIKIKQMLSGGIKIKQIQLKMKTSGKNKSRLNRSLEKPEDLCHLTTLAEVEETRSELKLKLGPIDHTAPVCVTTTVKWILYTTVFHQLIFCQ